MDAKVADHVEYVKNMLKDKGHKLLYMVKFGSHLYGTNRPESDTDLKGVFLPSKHSCYMCDAPKHFSYKTGDNDSKNTADDVDVQVWSLQYWLELVGKGETNALDLLYSYTYPEMVVYDTEDLHRVFREHNRLYDVKNCNSYVGYAIGQAKKYGVKGSRMGVVKRVLESLDQYTCTSSFKLFEVVDDLLQNCQDESYCFVKDLKGSNGEMKPYLVLCGSKHDLTIGLDEFYNRVKKTYDTYGERARAAEEGNGVDWKALSHALRAIDQMKQLLTLGRIQYPLKTAPKLKKVKQGRYSWPEVERMILDGLEEIEQLRMNLPADASNYCPSFSSSTVYALY